MSLNVDLTRVRNWEELMLPGDEVTSYGWIVLPYRVATTHIVVQMGLFIGVQEITEANVVEVTARIRLVEQRLGLARLTDDNQPYYTTVEAVRRHVGLQVAVTNAFGIGALATRGFLANLNKQLRRQKLHPVRKDDLLEIEAELRQGAQLTRCSR